MQKPLVAYKLLYHSYPVLANIIDYLSLLTLRKNSTIEEPVLLIWEHKEEAKESCWQTMG